MRSGRTGHSEVIHARSTEIGAVPEISVENRDYHHLSYVEIGGSIKGDVNKNASPSAGSREVFVSISSPLFADGSRSLERLFSGLLFHSLGSFFEW